MNLRSQIHAAIDEVARPAPALSRDAVSFALSGGMVRPDRAVRRPSRLGLGMRRAGSLVAIALVVLLLATLFVGGRLWRDWNTQQRSRAIQAQVGQLRERPVNLPSVTPGGECPISPFNTDQLNFPLGFGTGPVYTEGSGARYATATSTYFDTNFGLGYYDSQAELRPPITGVVLIRARDLVTNELVAFGTPPFANFWSGKVSPDNLDQVSTPSGTEVRTDSVFGAPVRFYTELVLDLTRPWWETIEALPGRTSGCIGLQADGFLIDGSRFSEVIVIRYDM